MMSAENPPFGGGRSPTSSRRRPLRHRQLERARVVAIVEHDQAAEGDPRRDVADHDVRRRQLHQRQRRRHVDLDRNADRNGGGNEAERIAAAGVDHGGRLRRLGGQHAERLGQPLRAPHEPDAQRVNVGDVAGARRREIAVQHDVEGGQRRCGPAESLELPAPRDQQRRETEDGVLEGFAPPHGCHPAPSCAVHPP